METISCSLPGNLSVSTAAKRIEMLMPKGSVWRIDGDPRGVTVACVSGTVWLTQENDTDDHVLEPSARFTVAQPGRTVVMALEESRISVARCVR